MASRMFKTDATRLAQKRRAQGKAKAECDWYLARGVMPPLGLFLQAGNVRKRYTLDALHLDTAKRMVGLFTALARVAQAA